MSINVSVITTANTTRHFVLNSVGSISHLLLNLKRSSRIFTGNLLVIGSGAQTEIFSTASIASEMCIRDRTGTMPRVERVGALHVGLYAALFGRQQAIADGERAGLIELDRLQ